MEIELAVIIILAVILTIGEFAWLYHVSVQPTIIDRQEKTLAMQHSRMDDMQREIDELRNAMKEDREEMAAMRAEMNEWRRGMELVFEQMKAAGLEPAWRPRPPRVMRPYKVVSGGSSDLVHFITEKFNRNEMDALAFDIGINIDDFGGDTREIRAIELVDLAHRRGLTEALSNRVKELRS